MKPEFTERVLSVRADAAMQQRMVWIEAVYAALGIPLVHRRPSVIVRRAIEAYVMHLESLLRREGDPAMADLRAAFEPSSVARAADDHNNLNLTREQLTALPVRPLSDIAADVRAQRPKVIDTIRQDLARQRKRAVYGIDKLVTNGGNK